MATTKRDERREEARKHIGLMNAIFASDSAESAKQTVIYEEGAGRELDVPEARFEGTRTQVTTDGAVRAAYSCKGKVAVLDPAHFTRPGGSYDDGGFAAEEQLCAESNLYNILVQMKDEYYEKNREYMRGSLYTDRAMYVPGVQFSHDGIAHTFDVIVVAPPNRERALERNRAAEECDADLARRVQTIMHIAAAHGADSLVLNAFGCGFFGNDPVQVAGLFKAWLDEHPGVFEQVVFSVFRGPNLEPFEDAFKMPEPEPQETPAASDRPEDDEDFIDVDNPDEGRWTFG